MRGNKLFLTLLLPLGFAVGCNEQAPSVPALTQTHLDDLGKGFSFETLQTSKTIPHDNNGDVETSKQIIETEAIKDKLTFIAHAPVIVGEPTKDDTLLA